MRLLIALLGLFMVTGCTTFSLEELRTTQTQGTPFQAALAKEYLQFADSEASQYDWLDSQYFAEKGLKAAYGNDVSPETPEHWNIPHDIMPELVNARVRLDGLLTDQNKQATPEKLARVQYYFDCWVEQQEENWQTEDIESCKHWFNTIADELENKPAKPVAAPQIKSSSYLVHFDWNRADLTQKAQSIIDGVIADLKGVRDGIEILLNGHSDKSGSPNYNMELSQQRVDRVKQSLLAGGISEQAIQTFAFGETDPSVPTKDGVREQANRRVEIFIND